MNFKNAKRHTAAYGVIFMTHRGTRQLKCIRQLFFLGPTKTHRVHAVTHGAHGGHMVTKIHTALNTWHTRWGNELKILPKQSLFYT